MFQSQKYLQVVGHTPVEEIKKDKNVISCDVFSTSSNGKPIGKPQFLILDTSTGKYTTTPEYINELK
jgi:hypothetical protein